MRATADSQLLATHVAQIVKSSAWAGIAGHTAALYQ
jgi:hypothetical protein